MNSIPLRTRIKFCGMTRPGDIRLACELGVDAIGLVFASGSARQVAVHQAVALREAVAPLVNTVALFQNNSYEEIIDIIRAFRPQILQFHGEEDDAFCDQFGLPYIKAVAMEESSDSAHSLKATQLHPGARALLLDSHATGGCGGSGQVFDWSQIPADMSKPFLLAGGLDPENVAAAIETVHPWGVDVSSGIESAPGIKDGTLMQQFVEQVRAADQHAIASYNN